MVLKTLTLEAYNKSSSVINELIFDLENSRPEFIVLICDNSGTETLSVEVVGIGEFPSLDILVKIPTHGLTRKNAIEKIEERVEYFSNRLSTLLVGIDYDLITLSDDYIRHEYIKLQ